MTKLTEETLASEAVPLSEHVCAGDVASSDRFHFGRVSILGWFVSALVLVQLLLFYPDATSILPAKAAPLLPLAALGLPYLVAAAFGRAGGRDNTRLRWGSRFALAFLAWAALSAALATTPVSAFFGLYAQLTGWIFLVCVAGAWAIATRLSAADRGVLELTIIVGATGNAVVAVIQQHVDLTSVGLPLYPGTLQPTGMLENPVFLGALLAGAFALVAPRFVRAPLPWAPVVAVIGLGLGVCGERLPLIFAVVLVAGELVTTAHTAYRSGARRAPALTRALGPMTLFAALALGTVVIGSLTAGTNTVGGGTSTGTASGTAAPIAQAHGGVISHIESSTSYETFGQRLDIWRVAWHAFAERPVIGFGPNQFRVATQARYTPSLVHAMVTDVYTDEEYYDGHDFIVELAVTVGIVGLALFAVWLYFCLRRRRGPLIVFALVLLASELAEPLNLVITVLIFVALGAAWGAGEPSGVPAPMPKNFRERWSTGSVPLSIASWALAGLAIIPGVLFVIGDLALAQGLSSPPLSPAAVSAASTAESLLSPWPDPASLWASIYATPRASALPEAIHWQQIAVDRDRTNTQLLEQLAAMEASAGHLRAAQQSVVVAVAGQPWNVSVLDLLGAIDQNEGRRGEARSLYRQSLAVLPGQQLIEDFLSGECVPLLPGSIVSAPLSLGCGQANSR